MDTKLQKDAQQPIFIDNMTKTVVYFLIINVWYKIKPTGRKHRLHQIYTFEITLYNPFDFDRFYVPNKY